ncbi:MAG TPA: HrcA family transcriptional regulator, partial [Dehalococcoidia bacterium]|nr:HrcA family transcriptional regulator [Dehalococcoidia bacterium]
LVLVFHEGGVKQQIFPLEETVSPSELTRLGNRITEEGAGLTAREIQEKLSGRSDRDNWAVGLVVRMMQSVDERSRDELHLEGLRYVLQQREFGDHDKVLQIVETLEDRTSFAPLLSDLFSSGGVRIIIGRENRQQALHDLSLVLARYGSPDEMVGAIGVVGPTRMAYDRILPAVRYLVTVLDDLVTEFRA